MIRKRIVFQFEVTLSAPSESHIDTRICEIQEATDKAVGVEPDAIEVEDVSE